MSIVRVLSSAAAVCAGISWPALSLAATSANLIVGGDGEAATCTADWHAVTTVPGWTVTQGAPAVACQSMASIATPSDGSPGKAFLADGPYGDSALTQSIDVSAASQAIDTGVVTYTLSGWLGGWQYSNGRAVVTATFLDGRRKSLGTAQLDGESAVARLGQSKFVSHSQSGNVPSGTRSIAVLVQFVDTAGSYNVGYADNLSLTLSTDIAAPALKPPASTVPRFDHVFVIMMENTDYDQVIGDTTNAPYINGLTAKGTLLTNDTATYHPSDENYLSIAGGDTFVQGAVYYPNIHVDSQSIADRLEGNGQTWKAYEQGMGTPCNTSNNNDKYYGADDAPFINFTNISGNAARCQAHLFDTTQLVTDLKSAATTPNFSWIAADDYYDGEASGNGSATSLQVQDGWLKQTLEPLFVSPAWTSERSLLILTWDESSATWWLPTGVTNHVATILVGSSGLVKQGFQSAVSYNHYSAGRTIEEALGLAPLTANDQYAQPINDAFNVVTSSPGSGGGGSSGNNGGGSSTNGGGQGPTDTTKTGAGNGAEASSAESSGCSMAGSEDTPWGLMVLAFPLLAIRRKRH